MKYELSKKNIKIIAKYDNYMPIVQAYAQAVTGNPGTYPRIRKKAEGKLKLLNKLIHELFDLLEKYEHLKNYKNMDIKITLPINDFKVLAKHFWTACEDVSFGGSDESEFQTITGCYWKKAKKINQELQKGLELIKHQ